MARLVSILAVLCSTFLAAPAQAQQNPLKLIPTCHWGPQSNPNKLELQVYEPKNIAVKPAVILALHFCGGTGPLYSSTTKYNQLADSKGFVVLYPSSQKDNNCWDVASVKTLTHEGGGDSTSLASMVKWAVRTYNADPAKVFVTGTSSGCMMSNVMVATYPDLFAAMSCYSGVSAGCLAGSPGSSPQTADPTCANGQNTKTGSEWAALARSMRPDYTGFYPRIQTFHGDADFFVHYANLNEQLKQWSTIHAVSFTGNQTNTPQNGYTKMVYGDGTKLVGYSAKGVGHVVPAQEQTDMEWFGL